MFRIVGFFSLTILAGCSASAPTPSAPEVIEGADYRTLQDAIGTINRAHVDTLATSLYAEKKATREEAAEKFPRDAVFIVLKGDVFRAETVGDSYVRTTITRGQKYNVFIPRHSFLPGLKTFVPVASKVKSK